MDCQWLKVSPSLSKGILVINQLDKVKFEQFIKRILTKIKLKDIEIFTEEERKKLEIIFKIHEDNLLLSIKTILYLFKRMLKFVFMPIDLRSDLKEIGLNDEKAEIILKIWSTETKITLDEIDFKTINSYGDALSFSWKLNAEVSSDCMKKSKIAKAYLSLGMGGEPEIEFNHPELYSVFLQFETIQNELDTLF